MSSHWAKKKVCLYGDLKWTILIWGFCAKNLDKHVTDIQNSKRDMVSKVIL